MNEGAIRATNSRKIRSPGRAKLLPSFFFPLRREDAVKAARKEGRVATYAVSTNSGANWATNSQAGPVWRAVASSADGNYLAAAANGGGIWLSRTVATPHLNIAVFGSLAKLSWTLPSTNFVLQQSADLHDWADPGSSPNLNLLTLQNEVIVTPTNGGSFYRLKTP